MEMGMTAAASDCLFRLSQLGRRQQKTLQGLGKRKKETESRELGNRQISKHSGFAVASLRGPLKRWRLSLQADRAAGSHPGPDRHKTQVLCIEPAPNIPKDNVGIVLFQPGVLAAL